MPTSCPCVHHAPNSYGSSRVEDSFQKVNDDSTKLFNTGAVVQRCTIWQMENGCPFMLSWNENDNVGFVTARDNDIIAHEKKQPSAVDGIICAFHGGGGNLNNWLFDNLRVENYEWALLAVAIANNPWGTAAQLGSISTILIRNLSSAQAFASPTPLRVAGNRSAGARIDRVVYEGVTIAGAPLTLSQVQRGGLGEFVTNVSVCAAAEGCGSHILADNATGWSQDQICGTYSGRLPWRHFYLGLLYPARRCLKRRIYSVRVPCSGGCSIVLGSSTGGCSWAPHFADPMFMAGEFPVSIQAGRRSPLSRASGCRR